MLVWLLYQGISVQWLPGSDACVAGVVLVYCIMLHTLHGNELGGMVDTDNLALKTEDKALPGVSRLAQVNSAMGACPSEFCHGAPQHCN